MHLNADTANAFLQSIHSSQSAECLSWITEPLVNYEMFCQDLAAAGDAEPLCDLIEHGSLITWENQFCLASQSALRHALEETHSRLNLAGLNSTPKAIVTRYFGGSYFSFLQASHLDILLELVFAVAPEQKDVFLAAVLSTASEVVNTVGKQFAQPLRPRLSNGKPKPGLAQSVARDRSIPIWDVYQGWLVRYLASPRSSHQHTVLRGDYAEVLDRLESPVSVVYADPPYTRDHYSRFYHVLETLCLRDNPMISTVKINGKEQVSRGLYRKNRHQSPFCIKSQAPAAFELLFSKVRQREASLVLSYSPYERGSSARPRLMTIQEIELLARKFYGKVATIQAGRIAHNKLNSADKNIAASSEAEVLIICEL